MASRQPDRYIPHVCDVFRLPTNGPRQDGGSGRSYPDKKYSPNEDHSDEEHYDYDSGQNQQKGHLHDPGKGRTNHSNNIYARTLTEKDLKHIERHLSMKKTIRKQISRHLSQAFVESENDAVAAAVAGKRNADGNNACGKPAGRKPSSAPDYSFTFTKSNFAKSESNFLDLLKEVQEDDEDDSGHCSPTKDMDTSLAHCQRERVRKTVPRNNSTESCQDGAERYADTKKSSFWKKLTVRGKSKR